MGPKPRTYTFLILSIVILLATSSVMHRLGVQVLPYPTPAARTAEAARSLWNLGRLDAPEFYDIRDDVSRRAREGHRAYTQDAFSVGLDGRLFPKHSLPSAVIAVPFYAVFGDRGFWILEQLLTLLLFYLTFAVANYLCRADTGFVTLLTCAVLTQTLTGTHSYIFSHDLHGAVLLMAALYLLRRLPLWGGCCAALAVWVRPSHIILLPFLMLAWPGKTRRYYADAALGTAAVLALMIFVNSLMFGSPWLTSYQRVGAFDAAGAMVLQAHATGFDWHIFLQDWQTKLFGRELGIFWWNPGLFLMPFVLFCTIRGAHRRFFALLFGGGLLYAAYVFSYSHWRSSPVGNRFLLPAVYFYALGVIACLCKWLHRKPSKGCQENESPPA